MKTIFVIILAFGFASCSNFTINGTICDQIQSDPNTQNIPKECRKYNEKEAQKAFDKVQKQKESDVQDIIKFQKEQEQ